MDETNSSKWIVRKPKLDKPYRLYAFPYSGGNISTIMPWQSLLHQDIELYGVQLPGHGSHFSEQLFDDMDKLVSAMMPLFNNIDKPFAFFGHSLGGLLAYQVCQRLQYKPECLIISGCKGISEFAPQGLGELSDAEVIEIIRNYGGTPDAVLQSKELMDFYIPAIKADFMLVESFRWIPKPPIDVPMLVLSGDGDLSHNHEKALAWSKETTRNISYKEFRGEHFFIKTKTTEVVKLINDYLVEQFNLTVGAV